MSVAEASERPSPIQVSSIVDAENPWPGLAAFREQDEIFFYGRDDEIAALLRKVMRQRLTILYSRPGIGKTSLLQAGLFPRLREKRILPVPIRLVYKDDCPNLTTQVRDAILRAAEDADPPVEAPCPLGSETLWQYFHRRGNAFWSYDNFLVIPLLVFDQFEEIFTHGQESPERIAESRELLADLAHLAEESPPDAFLSLLRDEPREARRFSAEHHKYGILFSLREDYLADLEELRETIMPSAGFNRLRLKPLRGRQAHKAVVSAGRSLVTEEVAEHIVRWVAGAAAEEEPDKERGKPLKDLEVEPALLSLVCRELNNKRRLDKAPQITANLLKGNRTQILETFYRSCLDAISDDVRPRVCEFIEERLLTPQGLRDTVALETAPQDEPFLEALETLQRMRLLRIESRGPLDRVELTHDILTAVVRTSRDARRQREAEVKAEAERRTRDEKEKEALRQAAAKAELDLKNVRLARNQQTIFHLVAVMIFVALGAAIGMLGWREALVQRNDAKKQAAKASTKAQEAERATSRANRELALADVRRASDLVVQGRTADALAFLARAIRYNPEESLAARTFALELLLRRNWPLPQQELQVANEYSVRVARLGADGLFAVLTKGSEVQLLEGLGGSDEARFLTASFPVNAADFHEKSGLLLLLSTEGQWEVWDTRTLARAAGPFATGPLRRRALLSPNGRIVLTQFTDGGFRLWDAETGRPLTSVLRHSPAQEIYWFEFSPDGRHLATAGDDYTARVWRVADGRAVGRMSHGQLVHFVRWSADSRRLVTGSTDRTASLWTPSGGRLGKPMAHESTVRWAEFSPDGTVVATVSRSNTARLWNARTGLPLGEPLPHLGVHSARFSQDSRLLITASSDGSARIWNARTGCPTHEPLRPGQPLAAAFFSPDGGSLLTVTNPAAPYTPSLRVWDVRPGRALEAILRPGAERPEPGGDPFECRPADPGGEPAFVELIRNANPPSGSAARLSRDGRFLAVAADRQVRIYRIAPDRRITRLPMDLSLGGDVAAVALNPDGALAAAASPGQWRVWDTRSGEVLHEEQIPLPHMKDERFIALSFGSGGRMAVATQIGRVKIVDTTSWQEVGPPLKYPRDPQDPRKWISSIELGGTGEWLVTASWGGSAQRWDLRTGELLPGNPVRHLGRLFSAELSPDGKTLLTAASNGTVRDSRADSGEPLFETLRHPVSVWSARYGLDGQHVRRIVTVAADGWIRLWDPGTGQIVGSFPPQDTPWIAAEFLPGAQSLVAVTADGTVRLWDTPTGSASGAGLLYRLSQAVSSLQVNERGVPLFIRRPSDVLQQLRRESASAPEGLPSIPSLVRWFLADRSERTISPLIPR